MATTKEKTTGTEVAKPKAAGQVAALEGYDLESLKADANLGTKMDVGDIALPYIYLLQKLSPQCDADSPVHIQGAQPGMLFNHVSQQYYEAKELGLMVIPCAYERKYVEWVHRDKGGGWVADHDINSNIISKTKPDDKGKPTLPNGNIVVETAYQYCLFMNPETETWGQMCIPMKSSMLKKNRAWNNMILEAIIPGTKTQAPRFLFPYTIRSILETKGENRWYNFDIERLDTPVSPEQYQAAKNFHKAVMGGLVKRAVESDEPIDTVVTGSEPAGERGPDDEIPF